MFLELNKKNVMRLPLLKIVERKLHMEKFAIIVRKPKHLFQKEVLSLFCVKIQ